ncbi:MAG: ATP-binding cassette domain-containing protein [Sphingomonas sp.]
MIEVALRRRLGGFRLDVAFTAPGDGVTALLGPSGAGKSATLAAIGGAALPDAGRVAIGGRVLLDTAAGVCVPPHRRRIGWVHQDARLFPHMPVAANLRYGQRRAAERTTIDHDEVVDVLGIAALLPRRVTDLSGGERQRVALGRALLSQPDLLLLDEPLAALDAARGDEILRFILRLKRSFALPMLYVTHDAREVRLLADHVVHLAAGRVVPAPPPAPTVTARIVAETADGWMAETTEGRRFALPPMACAPGDVVTIAIERPIG